MARGQRDDLHVTAGEERVGCDHERVGLFADECGKSDFYLAVVACVHDLERDIEGTGRRCEIFDESLGSRGIRVH